MGVFFEWNPQKAVANIRKHGVTFAKAAGVFGDPLAITILDVSHSQDEDRFIILGMSAEHRLLVVVPTVGQERIRIISAKIATRQERQSYAETIS